MPTLKSKSRIDPRNPDPSAQKGAERNGNVVFAGGQKGAPGSAEKTVTGYNLWRDYFNPLRNLTIERVVRYRESAMRGDFADLQWAYFHCEQSYDVMIALVERRLGAMAELEQEVVAMKEDDIPDGFTEADAENQRTGLRAFYDRVDNLDEAIAHLELAIFRGYSVLQVQIKDENGNVVGLGVEAALVNPALKIELVPIDHWHLTRDGRTGPWYYNPTGMPTSATTLGPAMWLDPAGLIVRENTRPVDRLGLETYVKHLLADKDWDGFLEIFGIPKPTITMPEGTPKGPEGDAYRDAATALAEAGYGALPHGSEVHYPTESGMNGSPFNERVGALRERMVLAGTGGLLTMITAPTGIGKGPSEQHADAFKALARKSAREIGEIFQRQFDGPFRKMEFPGQPVLAWFELCQESESENGVIADVKDLAAAGFIVDPDEVEERTGYTVTRAQQPAQPSAASQTLLDQMTGGGTPPAPDSRGTGNGAGNTDAKGNLRNRFVTDPAAGDALTPAGRAIAQSMADDFAGLRSELEIIIELAQDSPDLAMKALKKWNDRLPARAEKLLKNPRAAAAFEKMFLDAMNVGLHKLPP